MNDIKIINLTCNYNKFNLGIDSLPYFSWGYNGELSNFSQKSYQIIIIDNKLNIVWDSSKIYSDKYINIKYGGTALKPRTKYSWKITITDNNNSSFTSETAFFETGKLNEKWIAKWITAGNIKKPDLYEHSPYLRKSFTIKEDIIDAKLYITGLGYFEAYINGVKTGKDILSPSFTDYDKTIQYLVYDITKLLKTGENVLGAILGNGWYNCITKDIWNIKEVSWRHVPKMISELYIKTKSGKEIFIPSDSSWKSTNSPIIFNSIRNGEYYNANLEVENWNNTTCDDSTWDDVILTRRPGGILKSMEMESIQINDTIKPIKFWETTEDSWIFDLGKNISGFAKLFAKGNRNNEITIKYSERLKEDGINLDRIANAGFTKSGEFQTDKYIKKSNDLEIWSPRFVYHGFQYIELIGLDFKPTLKTVEGLVVHTKLHRKGFLTTSDETINRILQLAHQSTIGNFHGLLTDDPHREKNAWTGDVALSAEQTMFNYITILEFKKWLLDIKDSQKPSGCIPCVVPSTGWGYNWGNGPDWSSALTIIPWLLYVFYNDIEILKTMYHTIKKHCDYMESMANNYIVNYGIGDWCAPFDGPAISVNMSSFKCPTPLTDTSYFYNTANIISKIANVLDNKEDTIYYETLSKNIKDAFRKEFYNIDNKTVSGNCQTSTACMLYQELASSDDTNDLVSLLIKQINEKDNHLDFGILGNKFVMNTLGVTNNFHIGIKMITKKTYPGFGNIISKGATSLWETWNGTGSLNQQMFSDISASLYKYLGGIRPDYLEPGFKHIIMQPSIDCGINEVKCQFESIRGIIISNWSNINSNLIMDIQIPYKCYATLILPIKYIEKFEKYNYKIENNFIKVLLKAGNHIIK